MRRKRACEDRDAPGGRGALETTQKVLRRLLMTRKNAHSHSSHARRIVANGGNGGGGDGEMGQNLWSTSPHGEAELTAEEFYQEDVSGSGSGLSETPVRQLRYQ